MSRARPILLLLLVGLVVVAPLTVVEVVSGAEVAITNVTASPERPATGELVTFTTTVRNAQSASGSFTIDSIFIRRPSTTTDVARANDIGDVPPGSSVTVPLTATFETVGVKDLRVIVVGRDADGNRESRRYPVTVVVSDRGTQIDVDVDDPVAGEAAPVNVTVSNGGADAIRQLDLRLRGEGVRVDPRRRLAATLGAESDRTFSYQVTFESGGSQSLEAVLEYATTSGQSRTVSVTESVDVEELREDVTVQARAAADGGAARAISVEVTNFGNARLEEPTLRVTDGDRTVARRSVEPIPAGTSRDVRVNVTSVERADLDVTLDYETGGVAGQATTSLRYAAQPGRIALTGVDVERESGVTTITGSASNVGLTEVNSVVVAVQPAEGVTPAAPNREFFVGTVPASDFVSFDLTARIDGDVSAVPVQVTYISEGEERSETVAVPIDGGGPVETPGGGGGGGGFLVPALVGLVVLAAVGAIVYVGWRNRGGG